MYNFVHVVYASIMCCLYYIGIVSIIMWHMYPFDETKRSKAKRPKYPNSFTHNFTSGRKLRIIFFIFSVFIFFPSSFHPNSFRCSITQNIIHTIHLSEHKRKRKERRSVRPFTQNYFSFCFFFFFFVLVFVMLLLLLLLLRLR